jgi:predicted transcriptional regulator of viral defense system
MRTAIEGCGAKRPDIGRNGPDPPREHAIAALGRRQHGVVGLDDLVELGLSPSAIRSRVASGRLHRVHRGVFAVGHATLTRRGRLMAAVLACGEEAAVGYRCACELHELPVRRGPLIDVVSPRRTGRRRDGIRVHSGATLATHDRTVIDSIPCTSLARTLLDVADDATRREVERAIDRAEQQQVLDMRALDDVLARADGRRGAKLLRAVLAEHRAGSTLTRSELEEAFLAICRAVGLPPEAVNAWIPFPDGGGAEADFLWRAEHLIVEVDGRDVHTTRRAFDSDRRRDQRLMLLGWRVVRFTWRQVMFEPAYVAETLRGLLEPG